MNPNQDYLLPVSDDIASVIKKHYNARPKGCWSGTFTFMTWLYSPINLTGNVALELYYQDCQGEHIVVVDQCSVTNKSDVLLTNHVVLTIHEPLKFAKSRIVSQSNNKININILESSVIPAIVKTEKYSQQTA